MKAQKRALPSWGKSDIIIKYSMVESHPKRMARCIIILERQIIQACL